MSNQPNHEDVKRREQTIEFEMNYCQHYGHGKGADMLCKAGMDLKAIQVVPVGKDQIKWGPCIHGHLLENPTSYCPNWIRRTREQGEKRADGVERSMAILTKVMPFVNKWRAKPWGKQEVVECPACKGRLHLSQSSYNGHVHAKCETDNCANWME